MINFEKLVGLKVITANAFSLGEVKGASVNTQNWQITHLYVKLDDEASNTLGFKKRFGSSTVCVPVDLIKAVGHYVTIEKTLEDLRISHALTECEEQ